MESVEKPPAKRSRGALLKRENVRLAAATLLGLFAVLTSTRRR
jgi:hypothetical protein